MYQYYTNLIFNFNEKKVLIFLPQYRLRASCKSCHQRQWLCSADGNYVENYPRPPQSESKFWGKKTKISCYSLWIKACKHVNTEQHIVTTFCSWIVSFYIIITCHLLDTECRRRGIDWVTAQKSRCLLHGTLVWYEYDLTITKVMQLYVHCLCTVHYFRPTDIKWPTIHQLHFNIIRHTCTMNYQPIYTIPDCLTRYKGTWDLLLTEIKLKIRVTLYSIGTYQQPVPWHPSRWGLFLGFVPA